MAQTGAELTAVAPDLLLLVPCPLPFEVPFAGLVRAFTPVLRCCTGEALCGRQGCTLLFNLSCFDQYLQQESDFNKRTLSQLSYLPDRWTPANINPGLAPVSLSALCDTDVLTVNTNISQLANSLGHIFKRLTSAMT